MHYGLGSLNDNLPQFVVAGHAAGDCCGGVAAHGADYLGPEHAGVRLNVDPKNPLPFAARPRQFRRGAGSASSSCCGKLNRLAGVEYPDDPACGPAIKSYELAFRMQTAVPEVMRLRRRRRRRRRSSTAWTSRRTRPFGQQCLAARRLVERGVRFVQVFHGARRGRRVGRPQRARRRTTRSSAAQVDQPIAGLLKDLKQRGMLDETLVVWGDGVRPHARRAGRDGRDHHPYGFSVWLAGGGIKGGVVHGATDELGFHAVEDRHYVTDIHATVLHQLGLDPRRLEVPGRKRLEIDFGKPIKQIIA